MTDEQDEPCKSAITLMIKQAEEENRQRTCRQQEEYIKDLENTIAGLKTENEELIEKLERDTG